MSRFIIMTESGTDLPTDLAALHQIVVVPMHVVLGDKEYADGSIQVTDVYDYHQRTGKIPTTSAVSPGEYQDAYRIVREKNPDSIIIHISYSSEASSTYQNALIASSGMEDIYHVNSLNVTGGEAAIVLKAAALIAEFPDMSPTDLVAKIQKYVGLTRASFIPGNLEYLRAGGRVSNAAYLGASILHIKPLIEIVKGKLVSTIKYRGQMMRIAERYMEEYIERYDLDREQIYLLHSFGLEEAIKRRMEEIARAKGFLQLTWIQAGCVIPHTAAPGLSALLALSEGSRPTPEEGLMVPLHAVR